MRTITILFAFLIFTAKSQNYINYFNQANEAEYKLSQGDYKAANDIYAGLEKKFKKLKPKDYWYKGLMAYFQKDSAEGEKQMIKCAEQLGWPSNTLAEFQKKYPQLNISSGIIKKLNDIENEKNKLKKKAITDTLRYFLKQDSLARAPYQIVDTVKAMKVQREFAKYLKDKGLPDMLLYGEAYAALFMKADKPDVIKTYKELLFKQVKKGNVYPWYYTSIVDKEKELATGFTDYNSYTYHKGWNKEQLEEINKKRKEIGLSIYFKGPGLTPIRNFSSGYIKLDNQ